MKEEFLHHIWKYSLFNKNGLRTIDGRTVNLISAGYHNQDAGPDFFNAKVMLGETVWAGNVEIHVAEKDWNRHGHQHDRAYDNVILHVVYEAGGETLNTLGQRIPVVELKGKVPRKYWDTYAQFMKSKRYIPCEGRLHEVPAEITGTWLERVLVQRLERKSKAVLARLDRNQGDWQQTLFEHLAMNFGFKTNMHPMEMLARNLPFKLLDKHHHSIVMVEALLFGQAGFLEAPLKDDYAQRLQNEYAFLRKKFGLVPLKPVIWKFGRMRPANFPTIRIAQLANLLHTAPGLFDRIRNRDNQSSWMDALQIAASDYWSAHYRFDRKAAKSHPRQLGQSSRENILINTVVPVLFAYSRQIDSRAHLDAALEIIAELPAERNRIVAKMSEIGFGAGNASRSQALLELRSVYCRNKKCLNCAVGAQLLKSTNDDH